jgi:thioredoxin
MVRALWNGEVVAQSDDTVIIDGNHYFPAEAVDPSFLRTSDTKTVCVWKGRASYHSLAVGGETYRDAAWFYPATSSAAKAIEGRIAFGHRVRIEDEGHASRRRSLFDRFRRVRPVDDADKTRPPGAAETVGVVELDDATFFAALEGHVTIADFWAPWCGPCKTLHPMFDQAASDHATTDVQFVRVDVDVSPGISSAFNIMSIPTLILFDAQGNEIDREIGLPSRRRLQQLIRHAGSLAQTSTKQGAT